MFQEGMYEYGLKTGDLSEKDMIKIFEKVINLVAKGMNDSRFPKRQKLRVSTGPYGRSTPDAPMPEYDHIYIYSHRASNLFLQLYPNQETNGRKKFTEEGITWNLYVSLTLGYPVPMSADDHIQEYGGRVMDELFLTLPCEKVLIKKYKPGEDRL